MCVWITGKTAGKQRSTGTHQQGFKHLPGKEAIILSEVYATEPAREHRRFYFLSRSVEILFRYFEGTK